MKERQTETLGRARGRWRRALICYLSAGAALAILRVAVLVWLDYLSFGQHRIDRYLEAVLYPEAVLANRTSLTLAQLEGAGFLFVWGSIVAVVSFAMATPILLIGWMMPTRR